MEFKIQHIIINFLYWRYLEFFRESCKRKNISEIRFVSLKQSLWLNGTLFALCLFITSVEMKCFQKTHFIVCPVTHPYGHKWDLHSTHRCYLARLPLLSLSTLSAKWRVPLGTLKDFRMIVGTYACGSSWNLNSEIQPEC